MICNNINIDQLIVKCKSVEVTLGSDIKSKLYHDWTCDVDAQDKLEDLQRYRKILQDELYNISLGGEPCLDDEELQCLFERINKIIANCTEVGRPDIIVDDSNVDIWNATNPYCVSREKWEYLAYDILCDLDLEVSILEIKAICELSIDIVTKAISCDLMVAIDVFNKKCDLDIDINVESKEKCMLDFDILINNKKCEVGLDIHLEKLGCNITFDQYMNLRECNISANIITTTYENNACLNVIGNPDSMNTVELHTKNSKYNIKDINFVGEINTKSLQKYIGLDDSEYMKDPKNFVSNLNKGYSG